MSKILLLVLSVVGANACYYNAECHYQLFGSKTPYDTVRGDIRDHNSLPNCQAVSLWTLNRHGNRNPGTSVTAGMREMALIKDDIVRSYYVGNSQLCAQDIENFNKWMWNTTLELTQSYLTGTGYEELYDIGKRIREKYPHLVQGNPEEFYFRPTNEQRTIVSCDAFAHGFTDGTSLNVTVDDPRQRDDVIRPYENCDRYQEEVKGGQSLAYQLDTYFLSAPYVAIQNAVQQRLGIPKNLTASNVFAIYELCRFFRSWSNNLQSPWCSPFTDEDLLVLEYYDDVRHYHRNGYGSWVNEHLGRFPLKDLYENLEAYVRGGGRKVVSYFTHDTMMEMVFSALGLYKEDTPLSSLIMDPDRVWRTSHIGAFSVNIIAVLSSCHESEGQSYRVQIFINEKVSPICPPEGCSWQEFKDKFQHFTNSSLDFCSMDYVHETGNEPSTNSASPIRGFWSW
ncbi:multiple inositol polyphosphate phosphatase 1-like [Trichoplusia ni]|uniref:Multiple inositol polyphosphate phosphatase 1 n=1 Tax=Trichoplusia ni TaxID=7111 RepID=A0A7E5W2H1_TRINI|nr:multiple inositol polyphosphate phosphatase 1-like [Trichoplusia ni]